MNSPYRPSRRWRLIYKWLAYPLLLVLLGLLAFGNQKVRRTLLGRRGVWRRIAEQLRGRERHKPLVWFHVSSAGEYLQALPVLERCLAGGAQCALTVTSVSGLGWARRRQVQLPGLVLVDYLPFDFPSSMRRLLSMVQPSALVYVKYDLWPNLVWETALAGVPQFLVSATLRPGSKRVTTRLGRSFYRGLYAAMEGIFAVSEGDRKRFLMTTPEHPSVEVVGDTRLDSVLDRKRGLAAPTLPGHLGKMRLIVVGSSWPADEEHTLPVLLEALKRFEDVGVVMVPHEVHEEHVLALEQTFSAYKPLRYSALSSAGSWSGRVLLVNAMGLLSALYAYAAVAYVGGAFSTGVHNVMEPAVMGVPVLFGPRHENSPEAVALVHRGFGLPVADQAEFRTRLMQLLENVDDCRRLGQASKDFIEQGAGAAQRCYDRLRPHLK